MMMNIIKKIYLKMEIVEQPDRKLTKNDIDYRKAYFQLNFQKKLSITLNIINSLIEKFDREQILKAMDYYYILSGDEKPENLNFGDEKLRFFLKKMSGELVNRDFCKYISKEKEPEILRLFFEKINSF